MRVVSNAPLVIPPPPLPLCSSLAVMLRIFLVVVVRELLAAGRPDLRYALQKHGHMEIARELGVAVNPRGRPRKCRPEPDDSEDVNEEHMHIYR